MLYTESSPPPIVMNDAAFDQTRQYRFWLRRELQPPDETGQPCTFIMLNPSTADEATDDQTVRRCKSFAVACGCTTLEVVNLSPFRSSVKDALRWHVLLQETIDTNLAYVRSAVERSCCAVAAWGGFNLKLVSGATAVLDMLAQLDKPIYALRLTRSGAPCHPVRLPGDIPCADWPRLNLHR